MVDFYIPSMTNKEGYVSLRLASKLGEGKDLIVTDDGKVWNGYRFHVIGRTVFATKIEAQTKAKDMIESKIRSLKHDIENIESYMS